MFRLVALSCLLVVSLVVSAEEAVEPSSPAKAASAEQSMDAESKAAENELKALEKTVKEPPATAASGTDEGVSENETTEGAETEAEQSGANVSQTSKPWIPEAKDYDWVQLTSGEWLKGEIKAMYKDSLEFDSDKLDLLNIDWKDVKYLKTPRRMQVNFEGHEPVTGVLQVSSDSVFISHDYSDEKFQRSDLVSLSPAGDRELDLWAIKFTLGLNVRKGNTDQVDYTSKFNAKRRTAKSRFISDYIGNISRTNAGEGGLIETINNNRLGASLDIYASRYFYYTPVFGEYYRDPFQNIDQRITAGVGVGYTLFDKPHLEWNINGGPAFVTTKYLSVLEGEERRVDAGALILSTDIDTEISPTLDFIFKYNIQAARADAGGYTHHIIATFESEITGRLDFDISAIWDRIGQPTENDSGETPASDDYRLVVGITYTY